MKGGDTTLPLADHEVLVKRRKEELRHAQVQKKIFVIHHLNTFQPFPSHITGHQGTVRAQAGEGERPLPGAVGVEAAAGGDREESGQEGETALHLTSHGRTLHRGVQNALQEEAEALLGVIGGGV